MNGELRLGDIVLDKQAQDWRLFLCKPDTTIIAPVKDVENLTWNIRAGKVDEINFTIPAVVERDHQTVDNPLLGMIKHRYLFKMVYNNRETYLIHNEDDKDYGQDGESVSLKAYGRGYMLRDKTIRDYSVTSKNLQYILDEVLRETNWKVGFVDADINSKYRSHDVSNNNVLEIVYELVEKFGGLIVWDTVNLTINVYKPQNVGNDKGFRLREGKYLESFSMNSNSDEVVTRLKVYGKDGLTFRRLSPTGSNYIEDFSWFLYPFEMDEQGNVIRSSDYMSDGLAKGIIEYQNHLESIQGQFESLTTSLTSTEDTIQQREQELSILLSDLKIIEDELDVANSTGTGNKADITSRRNAKQAEIDAKASQIQMLENQGQSAKNQLDTLRTNVQMSNFLTGEQMMELNDYIITKDYMNDSIIDEEDLLKDGIEAFKTFRQPKVSLNIDIVNFLQNLESQNDWDKLSLGDTIYIKNSRLGVDISAKITEIQFNLTDDDINLTLANEHEILDSDELFLKKIYDAANTSTSVNMNQWKWDLVEETNSLVNRLLTEGLNAAERAITAGYKQNISISERGIIIKSDQEPGKWIIMQNGVIGLTNDNGNTWQVAVTPDGVYAQTLIGKIIMGSRLIIEDENGIIRLSGSQQEIFDAAGNTKVILGEYEDGKYGLKINNGAIEIENGLPENQIDPEATEKWNSSEQNAKDWAKEYADELKTSVDREIKDVSDALGEFSDEVNTTFKDGVISEAEAKSLETYINILSTEKADLDRRYTTVYGDVNLPEGTAKSALATAKTNYNIAHASLIDSVQKAIADDATTAEEKQDVDTKFASYRTAVSALTQAFENAIRAIETKKAGDALESAKQHTNQELANYVEASLYNQDIAEIQAQIDGSITSWFYPHEPTLSNAPANEWTTNDQRNVHLGDIFYNDVNGYAYRFAYKDGRYQWVRITDSDVTKALQDASNAQDTADQKRRTFVTTPKPPYDVGDLWVQGSNGDILRCVVAKGAGATYSASDWTLASKYTDDARAIEAEKNAINHANQLKQSIDQEIEDLEGALGELNDDINNTFRDGVISEAEARSIEKYINIVNSEKADVDSRYAVIYNDSGLTGTPKTTLASRKTAYNTAHSNLISSINTAIADSKTTTTEKADVDSKFTAYRTAISNLSSAFETAIETIAQAKATKALTDANTFTQGKIDDVNQDIGDVSDRVDGLKNFTDTAFADGIVDRAEKEALKTHIEQLRNEKADVDSRYLQIANNEMLSGTAKESLSSAKSSLDTAHSNLIHTINTAVSDNTITSTERSAVERDFSSYRSALSSLSARFEEAIKFIDKANIDAIEIGGRNLLALSRFTSNYISVDTIDGLNGTISGRGRWYFETGVFLEPNTTYTISNKTIENSGEHTDSLRVNIYDFILEKTLQYAGYVASGEAFTFKTNTDLTENSQMLLYVSNNDSGNFIIEKLKLEKGSKATDWTPAPEDVENQITSVKQDIKDVSDDLTSLDKEIKGAFKDGIVSETEATAIEKYINTLNAEKNDLSGRYNSVYSDSNLVGVYKSNLYSAKNDYDASHNALINSISKAISDGKATSAESADVDAKFSSYRTSLGVLSTQLEEAIRSIERKLVDDIEIGGRNLILNSGQSVTTTGYLISTYDLSEDWIVEQTYTITLEGEIGEGQEFGIWANGAGTNVTKLSYDEEKGVYKSTFLIKREVNTQVPKTLRVYNVPSTSGTTATINKIKMEKGNKATGWLPAPEDFDKQISDIKDDITDIVDDLGALDKEVKGAFKDGIISEVEARSIEKYINTLNAEKGDIDGRYSTIYNNEYLLGSPKTNLLNAKSAYNTAHSTLISSINTAISDGKATQAESENVDANFSSYQTALNNLSTALEDAVKSIEQEMVDSIQIGGRNLALNSRLDYIPSATYGTIQVRELVEDAEHGKVLRIHSQYIVNGVRAVKEGLKPGDKVTFSVFAKALEEKTLGIKLNSPYTNTVNILVGTEWGQYSVTTTINDVDDNGDIYVNIYPQHTQYWIKWVKLEKGTKPTTGWTPAPEDVSAEMKSIKNDVGDINRWIDAFEIEIDGSFKDGVIDEAEARAIEKYINTIDSEKADIDGRYDKIYNDSYLTGSNKTDLLSARNSYHSAHTSLVSSINNAIADGKATSSESADVDSKFEIYRDRLSKFSSALEGAVRVIEQARLDAVEIGGRNLLAYSKFDPKSFLTFNTLDYQNGVIIGAGTWYWESGLILEPNTTYTISNESIKNSGTHTDSLRLAAHDPVEGVTYQSFNNLFSGNSNTFTTTGNLSSNTQLLIYISNSTRGEFTIKGLKLEKGNKPTAWSPAPEDLNHYADKVADEKAKKESKDATDSVRSDLRLTAPLPTSISMDTNGITATTASSSNFARLDYRGLYVQGGAFDLRTSSSSNRGVKIDGSGIHAYNSSGTRTFYVDTNGNLNASRGTFSGSITGATGTFYGDLYAAGGTFKGTLSAVNGTFTSLTSGTISSAKITGTEITGGTITGTSITSTGGTGETIISAGTISHSRSFGSGENQSISIGSGSMIARYGNDLSGIDYYGRYQHNGVYMTSSSANYTTTYSISGISAFRYGSGTRQTFTIEANTVFQGTVSFTGATVTGLDLTAKFG